MATTATGVQDPSDRALSPMDIFWGEMAPCEHLVQIYQDDAVFLDALEGFVFGGIHAGDGVIVIATPAHLGALEHRLLSRGVDIAAASSRDQYIALDAERTLSRFMVNRWPDEKLFEGLVSELITRAGGGGPTGGGRRVRAFGEMVAVLWAQGRIGATVLLENLWHRFCQEKAFCLFCAYPRTGFTQDADKSVKEICAAHSRVVPG